jgi:hypothetical protein
MKKQPDKKIHGYDKTELYGSVFFVSREILKCPDYFSYTLGDCIAARHSLIIASHAGALADPPADH